MKKLNLKKETVEVLVNESLGNIFGGGTEPAYPDTQDKNCTTGEKLCTYTQYSYWVPCGHTVDNCNSYEPGSCAMGCAGTGACGGDQGGGNNGGGNEGGGDQGGNG